MPDNVLTWLCQRCGYREVWLWTYGTVLCHSCVEQIMSVPYTPFPYTPHSEGMERGRLAMMPDSKRTDTEKQEVFKRWQKHVNR